MPDSFIKEFRYGMRCMFSFSPIPVPLVMLMPTLAWLALTLPLINLNTIEAILYFMVSYLIMITVINFIVTIHDLYFTKVISWIKRS